MKTSLAGLAFIKKKESFSRKMYNDAGNNCTIGYGHLVHHGPTNGTAPSEKPFVNGISEAQASQLLMKDLATYEEAVNRLVFVPLNQDQFDALVDFTYNEGITHLYNSTLLKLLNTRQYDLVDDEFKKWVFCEGKRLNGLVVRRDEEAMLSNTPVQEIEDGGNQENEST